MGDIFSLAREDPKFLSLGLATTSKEIAPYDLLPFATFGAGERWLRDILYWARNQPSLHAAQYCYELGRQLTDSRRYRTAWPALETALTICRMQGPAAYATVDEVLLAMGDLLDGIVELPGAITYLRRALVIWRNLRGPCHHETAEILNNLGYVCKREGHLDAAQDCYQEALSIWQVTLGFQHPHIAVVLNNLGAAALEAGDPEEACRRYRRALAISRDANGMQHAVTGGILARLGVACRDAGNDTAACHYLRLAVSVLEGNDDSAPWELACVLNNLGVLHYASGEYDEAVRVLGRAYAYWCRALGIQHPRAIGNLHLIQHIVAASQQQDLPSHLNLTVAIAS